MSFFDIFEIFFILIGKTDPDNCNLYKEQGTK